MKRNVHIPGEDLDGSQRRARALEKVQPPAPAPIDRYTGLRTAVQEAIAELEGHRATFQWAARLHARLTTTLDAAPSFTDPDRVAELSAVVRDLLAWAEQMGGWDAPVWERARAALFLVRPTLNRVVLTIEGGVLQAVHADRPDTVLVTLFDFDVESDDDHPTVRRLDVPGRARGPVSVGVDMPVAVQLDGEVEAMLAQVQDGEAHETCRHCGKPITYDGMVWVDDPTGGDVCGWDGGNEPHEAPA